MTLPNLLLLGAAKSGTTSLARHLGAHPEIHMAAREIHFFDLDQNWRRGPKWYEDQFADAAGARYIAEKTPAYLAHPDAPERIASTLPDADRCRFVAILRDPTERAVSEVEHWVRLGREERPWTEALRAALGGDAEPPFDYVRKGHYADQLRRYHERFGTELIRVVFYEDLADDPERLLDGLFSWLGVRPFTPPDVGKRWNESRRLRHPVMFGALKAARAGAWLPPRLGAWIWSRLVEPAPHGSLPPELEAELRATFEPWICDLEELLGTPVPPGWRASYGTATGQAAD